VTDFKDTTFLFITSRSAGDTLGRVERRWLRVMKALIERGATVLVICPLRAPLEDRARALGATIAPYRMDKRNLVRTRSRLRKYLKRYRPVVAHATGFHADLLLRRAARGLPVKVAVSLMCGKWPPQGKRPLSRLLRRRADARSLGRVDTFFVDCTALTADLTAAGVSPERVVFDPPSVAVGRVADEATAPVARPHASPLVGYAGALELNRGLETLVAAAPELRERYPHIGIVVAGDGPARASLEAAVAEHDIGLMGPVVSVPAVLASLDVCVFPMSQPGTPTSLLEAAALGQPIVASAVSDVGDLFDDGVEISLFRAGDAADLTAAVSRLLDSPEHAREMGELARMRVIDEYSASVAVERHLQRYAQLMR
jgi:glycosyltransferase involved in cell wall biosynthesis